MTSDKYGDKLVIDSFWAEYVAKCRTHELNYLIGAYRSSKTTFNILGFAINLMETTEPLHLVIASSSALAKSLYEDGSGFGLQYIFAERYRSGKYKGFDAGFIKTPKGEKTVLYLGGATVSSYANFRGLSAGSIALEEGDLLHENTINEAQGRLFMSSSPKIFVSHNPCSTELPIRKFLESMQEKQPEKVNFRRVSIYNNPAMSEERRNEIISRYPETSIFYKRYIMGDDCQAEGIIYTLNDFNYIDKEMPSKYTEYIIVIDPGKTKSANAMMCVAKNVIDKTIDVVFATGVRNADNMSRPYTSIDYAKLETNFIKDCAEKLGRYPKVVIIDSFVGDDAYELFYKQLRIERIPTIVKFPIKSNGSNGKDDKEYCIKRNLDLFFRGKIRIKKDLTKVINDVQNITYDKKKLEKGIETYTDEYTANGHFDYIDCLDYATSYYGTSLNISSFMR